VLEKELGVTVNVGMGATDPVQKLQRFVGTVEAFTKICVRPPPGIDLKEIWKEMSGLSGYQDGSRFLIDGQDPTIAGLTQKVQALTMALQRGPVANAQAKSESNKV
jgi:hypothetical protein